MNIFNDVVSFYKKNKTKAIALSSVVLIGLIFARMITLSLLVICCIVYFWKNKKINTTNTGDIKELCPHCKTEVSSEASRCPHCQGKIYRWTTGRKILAGFIVCIFIGVIFSGGLGSKNSSVSSQEQAISERKTISIVFAKSVIEDILKAPSTAKFVDVNAYELSNLKDVWAVNGYVDSQNSFGAMIRSQWEVQLDYRDGKGGTVKSVLFDGKKMQ